MTPQTVLVTGATGLVGAELTRQLILDGHEVRCLVEPSGERARMLPAGSTPYMADVRDQRAVDAAVRGCQLVFHLAAVLSGSGMASVNTGGAESVARSCLEHGVERMVHVSTTGVYGTIRHPPVDEATPPAPDSLYRYSKWLGEQRVLQLHRSHGLPAVAVRLASVTGPHAEEWSGLLTAIAKGGFRAPGTGTSHLHTIDVRDAAAALRQCGTAAGLEGECIIAAGPEAMALRSFLALLAEALEAGPISFDAGLRGMPFLFYGALSHRLFRSLKIELPMGNRYNLFLGNQIFDTTKSRRLLGHTMCHSVRESIHDMMTWFRDRDQ